MWEFAAPLCFRRAATYMVGHALRSPADRHALSDDPLRPGDVAVGVFGPDLCLLAHTGDLARRLGLPAEQVMPSQSLAALLGPLSETAPPPWVLQCRTVDGRLLHLAAEALSDGGWSLAVIDITAPHAAARALREAHQAAEAGALAKARFLATMNHELRTPLNAVIGFAETLARDAMRPGGKTDPQETQEFALYIRDAGRHLLTLIDDILDLVRIDSGACEMAADTVDPGRLVQTALRAMEAAAQKGKLEIAGRDETGGVRLRADERRLRRLLGHLLGNAVKFTRSGGSVSVAVRLDAAGDVRIEVRDTGVGMAPEDLKRALQSFQQLDTRHARRAGGAGIGLYLSRAIAEAHGGTLLLDSAPDQGTTATLVLPRARLVFPSLQPAQESP